jgi:hypothetical protein
MPKRSQENEIELHPDAWERFERATKAVVKSPPQHRIAKKNFGRVKTKPTKAKKKPGK